VLFLLFVLRSSRKVMSHEEDEVVVEDDDLKVDVEELPEEKSVDGSLNASTDGEEDKVCSTKFFSKYVC